MQTTDTQIAIRVSHLSKKYARHGHATELRSVLGSLFKRRQTEYFWALKDVSFELKKGKILGVIGENGSGKSTLLKILSGITKPTEGEVEIFGRIASILDIGTGFHPDLTGRENIYLRAGFLGIAKSTVEQKIVEIETFSGIGSFMDMPIKHYSDGMFLRLAFSFLIIVDSDILLLDEVLSVGDAGFQLKCIEKIHQTAKAGKTIILVSHQPQQLAELCTTYLHLEKGMLVKFGDRHEILKTYLHSSVEKMEYASKNDAECAPNFIRWNHLTTAPGNELIRFTQVSIVSSRAEHELFTDEDLTVEIEFQKLTDEDTLDIAFSLRDELFLFMVCHPFHTQNVFQCTNKGLYRSRCIIPGNLLNKGNYQIGIFVAANRQHLIFSFPNALSIELKSRGTLGKALDKFLDIPMPLMPVFKWELYEPSEAFILFTQVE